MGEMGLEAPRNEGPSGILACEDVVAAAGTVGLCAGGYIVDITVESDYENESVLLSKRRKDCSAR
jgi:hypothetical protein